MESKPSQSLEHRDNLIKKTPRFQTSEPISHSVSLAGLEDVEAFGTRTLEQAAGPLEHPVLEQGEALEQTLERNKMLEEKPLEEAREEEPLEPPTKEELHMLKEVLKLDKGSLHYKRRGEGIYHVVYDSATKKYRWTHLGSWSELKTKITE